MLFVAIALLTTTAGQLENQQYRLVSQPDHSVAVHVAGMPPVRLSPEFTVLYSPTDPHCHRNPSHPNYAVAPRVAVRWKNPDEPIEAINAWLATPHVKTAIGLRGEVSQDDRERTWLFRDTEGRTKLRIAGIHALDTSRPFCVGQKVTVRAVGSRADGQRIAWRFASDERFAISAELTLPPGKADPQLRFTLTPRRNGWFSVAYTGMPASPLTETVAVPQECSQRHRLFDYVIGETDLHLPRAHVATAQGSVALAADPAECRFRLPTMADSRFGLMLTSDEGCLKPALLAPLLGGCESRMKAGKDWQFTLRCIVRAGDWKDTYAWLARGVFGLRDQRDNSGTGSLNATLARVIDFLADRPGGNYALWDEQQKYYDYFTDKTGVFKPFSPLFGLSAAIVTDDEDFFVRRARPAVEFALSRPSNVFAPYDAADNGQVRTAGQTVGGSYLSRAQLLSLHQLLQGRSPAISALANATPRTASSLAEALADWREGDGQPALERARRAADKLLKHDGTLGEAELFDLLDLALATGENKYRDATRTAAYHAASRVNLYPAPPDALLTVDRGGHAPVHFHSFGRHRNIWGFPEPQPLSVPEQTVPAWRIARVGLPGIAYPIEYWMNAHGALLRVAGFSGDELLADVARGGMVGRFGNYPGDNRSLDSLVAEQPDAVARRPWQWNFATVNPGHAWDFAAAVIDFLVSDAAARSQGAIEFPAVSAAGSLFRTQVYGALPGRFYNDRNVRLWLPRGVVHCNNRQIDWLAGHGNGQFYLACWNQSSEAQSFTISLSRDRVAIADGSPARQWRENQSVDPVDFRNNAVRLVIAPKGIMALAVPASVKTALQAKLYAGDCPSLGQHSYQTVNAPFGRMHGMLLRLGKDLTSAYVYTEAVPEDVIAARLYWRQGAQAWQCQTDNIFPYEFSPALCDDGGDLCCVIEIEDAQQRLIRSPMLLLGLEQHKPVEPSELPPLTVLKPETPKPLATKQAAVSDDFLAYLCRAANPSKLGRRADGRYYPYSTPQGRRIAWRLPVWDKRLYHDGCTADEATQQLRATLGEIQEELRSTLARRTPPVAFAELDRRQQETLLDLALSESTSRLNPDFLAAVLARDWQRMIRSHLYVRYAGHAPDHSRNKAFAERWAIH